MALRIFFPRSACMSLALTLSITSAWAGNYGVSPLSFSFSTTNKSGVLTVSNDDKEDLDIRIRPKIWIQNASGEDNYQDTNDLVVFPRRLSLKPGEKKIIRLGVNDAQTTTEKAYRLFLEEVAPPKASNDTSAKLSVLINIGVPVFVTPAQAVPQLTVQPLVANNKLKLELNNQGNAHIRLSRITDEKGNTIASNFSNRYVFSGVRTTSDVNLPASLCNGSSVKWLLETSEAKPISLNIALPSRCNS